MIPFLIALAAPAPTQTPADIFAGLAGSCFRQPMPQNATDTHCFTVATGGKLAIDVHAVRDAAGKIVYQGVTVYTPSSDGKVALAYSNSLGDVMPGNVTRSGDKLSFMVIIKDVPVLLSWTVRADGYDVDQGSASQRFVRVGPAGEAGF